MNPILIGTLAGALTFAGLMVSILMYATFFPSANPLEEELRALRNDAADLRANLAASLKRAAEFSDAAEQVQVGKEVVETELELSRERATALADALATVHALANRIHTITTPFGIENAHRPAMSAGYEGAD